MNAPGTCGDPSGGGGPPGGATSARNVCLVLEYDGTDFCGWQRQSAGRSVQGELERALATLLRERVQLTGAGRTDAGTHALGQVANFRTGSYLAEDRLRAGLNGLLPADVAVRAAFDVPAGFSARYSARRKRYRYRIDTGRPALCRRYVWAVRQPLDAEAMQRAAASLPGAHSFGAFCKQDPPPASLACRILDACLYRCGPELVFEIEADRFLRHMVRAIVGTLREVGSGRRAPAEMAALLASGDRPASGPTAPACGLCLLWVDYPDVPQAAVRWDPLPVRQIEVEADRAARYTVPCGSA